MTQELPAVRIATPAEEDEVMAMCRRLHKENGLFTLSEKKVRDCIRKCFTGEGTIVGVVGEPGKLKGSICMSISEMYYTEDWHLTELWNYVEPEFRVSRNAEAMIEFGKACANKMGIPFFTGIITNKQMAGKVRLYRRLLGYPLGAFFVHNAPWETDPMEDHFELRNRLRNFAMVCNNTPRKVTFAVARSELGPLLREAAEAITVEDNIWSDPAKKTNGAAVGAV
jgi:hypothetical protein